MSHTVNALVALARIKWLVAVAGVTLGLVLVGAASAHQLTESKAERGAASHAAKVIRSSDNDYTAYRVFRCVSGVPHRVNCDIGYDTPETAPTRGWACTETVQIYYKAHSENDPRMFRKYLSHPC